MTKMRNESCRKRQKIGAFSGIPVPEVMLMPSFHALFRAYLDQRKLTIYRLSKELQIDRSTLYQVQSGARLLICTPFTGHPVGGVLLCGTRMSTKGNV